MPRPPRGLGRLRPFPRVFLVPRLPLWTRSAGLGACYMPREHCQFPMSIWLAHKDLGGPLDWAYTFCHEYGHFLLDWATTPFPFRIRERVQLRYDDLCQWAGVSRMVRRGRRRHG